MVRLIFFVSQKFLSKMPSPSDDLKFTLSILKYLRRTQIFLTASSAHAVLNTALLLLLFALDVCESFVQNEGKLKHVDKTC